MSSVRILHACNPRLIVLIAATMLASCGSDSDEPAAAGGSGGAPGDGGIDSSAGRGGGAGHAGAGTGGQAGAASSCDPTKTGPFHWDPSPPSTLLGPGCSSLALSLQTGAPASCGWSLGQDQPYGSMKPFDEGQGTACHATNIPGLNADPQSMNDVYVRCDAQTDSQPLHLQYRCLSDAKPSFPRTGNLWGSWELAKQGLEHCARVDLFLGAGFKPEEIRQLRTLNPNILILTDINTVEHADYENLQIPDSYWLKDTTGKRIEVWPGAYRVNLTKPEVATYQAHYAYQLMLDSGLSFDGVFFDNFFTSQSWLDHDVWGNAVQVDANDDGQLDDPKWLDAEWRKGVYSELGQWRDLMPFAYASGHLPRPPDAELGAIFNGDSIGITTAAVRDGDQDFAHLWDTYQGWWQVGRVPVITMIEGSPPDQIAYGYDYSPSEKIPPSTLEFARTLYPYMRFGLGVTLMNDGYYAYEFGDTWHGNDWWYDEFDADLGQPCGPATRVALGTTNPTNLITNGSFELPVDGNWSHWVNTDSGAAATFSVDTAEAIDAAASMRVDVTAAGQGVDWHVGLYQENRSIVQGVIYDLIFFAKADADHGVTVGAQKGAPDWHGYGLWKELTATTTWKEFTATFEANETASDARFQFSFGSQTGTVWIDNVRLVEHPADVFRRDFSGGAAILNASRARQSVPAGPGLRRLTGQQAPRYQYIVDDDAATFTGAWQPLALDSELWVASGPFFHDWGPGCHQLNSTTGDAVVPLDIRADDTYTLDAWWAAAPEASGWSKQVVVDVLNGGTVVATQTFDQSTGGDQWHRIAQVALTQAGNASVRIRNQGSGAAIADAILVQSSARYNDGSAVSTVELEAMDAIVLKRDGAPSCD